MNSIRLARRGVDPDQLCKRSLSDRLCIHRLRYIVNDFGRVDSTLWAMLINSDPYPYGFAFLVLSLSLLSTSRHRYGRLFHL